MSLPESMKGNLKLPLIGSPMFIISQPELVLAQCKAGIVGAFPSLNARSIDLLDDWLTRIDTELTSARNNAPDAKIAPYAVNLIVHRSNTRLEEDLELVVKHKVPIVITSLGARQDVFEAVRSYGGVTLHDVINMKFSEKALEKGADGLIAVAAGAGGHAGTISPFALVQEIRQIHNGPLFLSGAIASGASVLAAQAMGADGGYMGSAFIACDEAVAPDAYKDTIVEAVASDIVYTNLFTGVHGNYLAQSIRSAGMDPENLAGSDPSAMCFKSGGDSAAKVWRDIWGSGQGVGAVKSRGSVSAFVHQLYDEYQTARAALLSASTDY